MDNANVGDIDVNRVQQDSLFISKEIKKEDLLLYGVTDSKYLKGRKMSELVEEAILGGVTMIQLREKEMTHEAFKQEALDVQRECQKHHVPLIINDDVELCK